MLTRVATTLASVACLFALVGCVESADDAGPSARVARPDRQSAEPAIDPRCRLVEASDLGPVPIDEPVLERGWSGASQPTATTPIECLLTPEELCGDDEECLAELEQAER